MLWDTACLLSTSMCLQYRIRRPLVSHTLTSFVYEWHIVSNQWTLIIRAILLLHQIVIKLSIILILAVCLSLYEIVGWLVCSQVAVSSSFLMCLQLICSNGYVLVFSMDCLITSRVFICRQKVIHILFLLLILSHGRSWLSCVLDGLKLLGWHSCHLLPLESRHIRWYHLLVLHTMSLLKSIVVHCCVVEPSCLAYATWLLLFWLSGILSVRLLSISYWWHILPHLWSLPWLLILVAHLSWPNFVVESLFGLGIFEELVRLHFEFADIA